MPISTALVEFWNFFGNGKIDPYLIARNVKIPMAKVDLVWHCTICIGRYCDIKEGIL